MKYLVVLCGMLMLFPSCRSLEKKETLQRHSDANPDLAQYVNPFVGTKNMGHTFPGAAVPFGMVQLSPQTNRLQMFDESGKYNPEAYRYCSGYQYEDTLIYGFAHTHFSGTGHSDLGDVLLMPFTGSLTSGNFGSLYEPKGFRSAFSHEDESAEPGFYKVRLKNFDVLAELTASEHVGFHQYSFPENDSARLFLDMTANIYNYDGKNVWTFLRIENDSTISGYRQTSGWARTRTVYFVIQFSEPVADYGHTKEAVVYKGFYRKFNELRNFPEMAGREIKAYFTFNPPKAKPLRVKVALSGVSTANALNNLNSEVPDWDFEQVKSRARAKWNKELSSIRVKMMQTEQMKTFYTALYHTMLSPVVFQDVNNEYRGLDQNTHIAADFRNYSIFSLWDTYRALHPLFNLIQTTRNNHMVHSMLAHHDQSVHKMLPVWSHYANENWCMIGYHAVSVLADALIKGTTDADPKRILEACLNTSKVNYFDGLGDYIVKGYVPEDRSSNSVSKTLEYAYNDWCIAQIADKAGNKAVKDEYLRRSENYLNVFDAGSGYMRPKLSNGGFRPDFDPIDTHGQGFIEGNALNYGLYVPHQTATMIDLMGGKEAFAKHLDIIFETEISDEHISKNEDITRDGIIGSYVHGNEPGHHIPYLYNFTGYPQKTQQRVRMIVNTMYSSSEDGLCGNDDAGQMSAWYVFSALGFYPVLPGSDIYEIGSPLVEEADLSFENGKILKIKVLNQSEQNVLIDKVVFNGTVVSGNQLKHSELVKGGLLEFYMKGEEVAKK